MDCELEIPVQLEWGRSVTAANQTGTSLQTAEGECRLVGLLEGITEHGVGMIRLGAGVFLIEADQLPCLPGTFLEIRVKQIEMYSTGT